MEFPEILLVFFMSPGVKLPSVSFVNFNPPDNLSVSLRFGFQQLLRQPPARSFSTSSSSFSFFFCTIYI